MTTKKPLPYAKVKTITSMSGANATRKHMATLRRTREILLAQGDDHSAQLADQLVRTIHRYQAELNTFYLSEHYPYRGMFESSAQ